MTRGRRNDRDWDTLNERQHAVATKLIAAGVLTEDLDGLLTSTEFANGNRSPQPSTGRLLVTCELPIANTASCRTAEPLTSDPPPT